MAHHHMRKFNTDKFDLSYGVTLYSYVHTICVAGVADCDLLIVFHPICKMVLNMKTQKFYCLFHEMSNKILVYFHEYVHNVIDFILQVIWYKSFMCYTPFAKSLMLWIGQILSFISWNGSINFLYFMKWAMKFSHFMKWELYMQCT